MPRWMKSSALLTGFVLSSVLAIHIVQDSVRAQQPGAPQQDSQRDPNAPTAREQELPENEEIVLPRRSPSPPQRPRTPLRRPPSRGGIDAKITLSPICSVVAPVNSCVSRPYVGALRIERLTNRVAGRNRVIRTQTDTQGRVQIRLEPGLYTIEPETGSFSAFTRETVRVLPQRLRSLEIVFQGTVPDQPQGILQEPRPGIGQQPRPGIGQPQPRP